MGSLCVMLRPGKWMSARPARLKYLVRKKRTRRSGNDFPRAAEMGAAGPAHGVRRTCRLKSQSQVMLPGDKIRKDLERGTNLMTSWS